MGRFARQLAASHSRGMGTTSRHRLAYRPPPSVTDKYRTGISACNRRHHTTCRHRSITSRHESCIAGRVQGCRRNHKRRRTQSGCTLQFYRQGTFHHAHQRHAPLFLRHRRQRDIYAARHSARYCLPGITKAAADRCPRRPNE